LSKTGDRVTIRLAQKGNQLSPMTASHPETALRAPGCFAENTAIASAS
jgi:hypothetical protein